MSRLSTALQDYLTIRRALGFHLKLVGWVLTRFVAYADEVGAETVTTDLAVAWATQPVDASPVWWKSRLTAVRGFADTCKRSIRAAGCPRPPDTVGAERCGAAPSLSAESRHSAADGGGHQPPTRVPGYGLPDSIGLLP